MVTGELAEGRTSATVLCSLETAAAHAESLRRDVVIDRFESTFCDRIVQNGQTNRVVSRRARPPTLVCSICSMHGGTGRCEEKCEGGQFDSEMDDG